MIETTKIRRPRWMVGEKPKDGVAQLPVAGAQARLHARVRNNEARGGGLQGCAGDHEAF